MKMSKQNNGYDAEAFRKLRRTRDPKLRDKIILDYEYFARASVIKYARQHDIYDPDIIEDLQEEGVIGLIRAIDKFDPNKGVVITTYAHPYVIGAAVHWLRDKKKIIHIPANIQDAAQRLKKIEGCKLPDGRKLSSKSMEHEEYVNAAADYTSLTLLQVEEALRFIDGEYDVSQLEHTPYTDDNGDDRSEDFNETLSFKDSEFDNVAARDLIADISGDDEQVEYILTKYILDDETFDEIGSELKLTGSRISQIFRRSISAWKNRQRTKYGEVRY